jgi:hypothetical protein
LHEIGHTSAGVDPDGYRKHIAEAEADYVGRLAAERREASPMSQ